MRGEVFYEQRLETGRSALLAQRHVEAAEQLRIAAFGLLDQPKKLSQALALLAVAQKRVGWGSELEVTLNRFLEVERRFAAYDGASLDPPLRTEFESIVLRSVPKDALAPITSLAPLVQPASTTPRRQTAAPKPPPSADDLLRRANGLIDQKRPSDAASLLVEALRTSPTRRDLRLALLKAASMSSQWQLGASQVPALLPFGDAESVYMFFAAVSMYETGQRAEARELLDRALPRLSRSAYVDQYARKITGRDGS